MAASRPLRGLRVLTLGLNLPAPVALQRARRLGARVRKLEPPGGDPVAQWQPALYAALHAGVSVRQADLRTPAGQACLAAELARADVLVTSFRPAALKRLGLSEPRLRRDAPHLDGVRVVGACARPDEAGHDLTYQAAAGVVADRLPATLWADMAGAQAVVQALLTLQVARLRGEARRVITVGLADALEELTAPRAWGLTGSGDLLGGGHAGYAVYRCAGGTVAVAALEPKFALALAQVAGLPQPVAWSSPATRQRLARWFAGQSRATLEALADAHDLPLVVCPEA